MSSVDFKEFHEGSYSDYQPVVKVVTSNLNDELATVRDTLNESLTTEISFDDDDENGDMTITSSKDAITNVCDKFIEDVSKLAQKQISYAVECMYNKEIDKSNNLRSHFDKVLNTCRVAYRLEKERYIEASRQHQSNFEKKITKYYNEKINRLDILLKESQDVQRIQQESVQEFKQRMTDAENRLRDITIAFESERQVLNDKGSSLSKELDKKRKKEVYDMFKIIRLRKELKKAYKQIQMKALESKNRQRQVHDLTEKLQVSIKLRKGLKQMYDRSFNTRRHLCENSYAGSQSLWNSKNSNIVKLVDDQKLQAVVKMAPKRTSKPRPASKDQTTCISILSLDKATCTEGNVMKEIGSIREDLFETKLKLSCVKKKYDKLKKQHDDYFLNRYHTNRPRSITNDSITTSGNPMKIENQMILYKSKAQDKK